MIQPKIAKSNKVLIIFDVPQHESWVSSGEINRGGISKLLDGLQNSGIDYMENVSIHCLSDDLGGKAQGFKDKEEYTKELVETIAPNLIVMPSAKAFERCMEMKGASKFYGKVLYCEKYKTKAIVIPPYSILNYRLDMQSVIDQSLRLIKEQMEFSEIIEKEKSKKNYVLIDTIDKFKQFHEYYKNKVFRFALDIETTSLQFNNGDILTIQFSHKANFGYCIPTNHYHGTWKKDEWDFIVASIKELVEDDSREKIGANIFFDLKFLNYHYGIRLVKENVTDVLIQSFLTDENRESHSLKFCAATLLEDAGDYDSELELFKSKYCKEHKIKKADFKYSYIPLEILYPYSCMDVDYSLQLADFFKPLLVKEQQEEVFKDVSSYAWALARIESSGWKIDLKEAARYRKELEERISKLDAELQELPEIKAALRILTKLKLEKENEKRKNKITELKTPLKFLVNSVNHKRLLFRDILRFPEIKKTKKGAYATDSECFAEWSHKFPNVKCLSVIKQTEELKKMLSTYVMTLLNKSVNGRIHCSFRVCGARTGRISSSNPSMQNIAMHSEEAQKLKKCFISDDGYSLVVADLSNAELRVTAALSQDTVLCAGFKAGLDPHSNTAKQVFNLDCEVGEIKGSEKYDKYRQLAKTLGFAALYGAKPPLIAKKAGISNSEAQQHLDEYFDRHYGISQLLEDNIKFTKKHGYALAANGRKRRVPNIASDDDKIRERAERQANNFIVQSVTSDGMLQSIVNMWLEIDEKKLPYKIINVIHDSVECEIPDAYIEEAAKFIIKHLSRFPKGVYADFPMKADAEFGKNWADLKEFEINDFALEILALDEDTEEDQEEDEAA